MHIDAYSFGKMIVDGHIYQKDLILFPNKIQSDWWRREGHVLNIEDLQAVIDDKPDVLIVGTGASGVMKVPTNTREALEKIGIQLITENTHEAYKKFNDLIEKGENVIGAFHLTC